MAEIQTVEALAARGLFFLGAPALLPPIPPIVKTAFWVLVGWTVVSILFGILIWPYLANWFLGPRRPEADEEEAAALRRHALEKFFKDQQKKNRKSRD